MADTKTDVSPPDRAQSPEPSVQAVDMTTTRDIPRWKYIWQHSLTQMILLSIQAFCGPAMSDAIAGLGGGGLATPQVSNISTALRYAALAFTCFMGGPIVNKIGVKWALVIGSMSFPIQGSAYYCNSKFGNQWYLILSGAIGGIGTGCWYVAEAGAIMTLAPSGARGKYLALWIVSRNLGQLVGGAINIGCFGLGFILDAEKITQRRRAQIGLYTVAILNVGVYIWSIIMQARFNRSDPGAIDWDDGLFATSFLPYFFVQTTGPLSQSYMYWLLSSFATDAQENVRNGAAFRCIEAIGQAIAYGMNSQTKSDPLVGFCVTFALLGASLLPMVMLVNTTPDKIPADEIAEQQAMGKHFEDTEGQAVSVQGNGRKE
ncbi:hypothetical protein ACHAPI_007433 [Fusarium lateritium]